MKIRTLTTLITLSSLLTTSVSFGWDSGTRNGVRDMPIVRQQSFAGVPKPVANQPGIPNYDPTELFVTNLKDRVGSLRACPHSLICSARKRTACAMGRRHLPRTGSRIASPNNRAESADHPVWAVGVWGRRRLSSLSRGGSSSSSGLLCGVPTCAPVAGG